MKALILLLVSLFVLVSSRVSQPSYEVYNVSKAGSYQISTAVDNNFVPLPYPPASDHVWNTCKCRGQNFLEAMQSSKEAAGKLFNPTRDSSESTFTEIAALNTWSWKAAPPTINSDQMDKAWAIDHVLRAIGVSDKSIKYGGNIHILKVAHGDAGANGGGSGPIVYDKQQYTAKDRSYRVTGSEYTFGFDPSGVLLALDRKSPQFAGSQRNPKIQGNDLPDLQTFSDIAWLKWKEVTGSTPSSMRYFASLSISNVDTRGIIYNVLSKAKFTEMPGWPGHDVDANTENGAALLGSPNALAFSYFLVQHKATLGDLKISKITLFKNGFKFADPCMLLHVEKAELKTVNVEWARL